MIYNVEIRVIEPERVAFITYNGEVNKANKVFPAVFKAIKGKSNGAPFFHFLKMDPETKIATVELCVPTHEGSSNPTIQIKNFTSMKTLCTTHVGCYDTLSNAYKAIRMYAIEHNILLDSTFREVYVKGPGAIFKGNPLAYITDIIIPILEVD